MKKQQATTEVKKSAQHRKFSGIVMSRSGNKSIIVAVTRTLVHPKYGKRYIQTKRYAVHDEHNTCKVNDNVQFVECRPLSSTKRWRVLAAKA